MTVVSAAAAAYREVGEHARRLTGTTTGLRLKLTSERSGEEVLLDVTVLEALCHLAPQRLRSSGDGLRAVEIGTPHEAAAIRVLRAPHRSRGVDHPGGY